MWCPDNYDLYSMHERAQLAAERRQRRRELEWGDFRDPDIDEDEEEEEDDDFSC